MTDVDRGLAGSTLRDALARSGRSAAALAAASGASRALVNDYLSGAKQPSVAQLARLLRSLGFETVIDLVPAYAPLTLQELGAALAVEPAEARRWRLLQEFLRGYGEAPAAARPALLEPEPALVEGRWDALLAGVAEHLAFHGGQPVPPWAFAAGRVAEPWWFPGAVDAEGRTWRMLTAPAALAARGVWLERAALERAA